MKEIIPYAREILVSTPDTVCLDRARLVTEAYQRFAGEPVAMRRAKTFAYILENMTLDLETNPIFAGNTSSRPRAWMLLPEYGFNVPDQAIVENPALKGFLDGDAIPRDIREFWAGKSAGGSAGIGHLAVHLERVLTDGLDGIIAEAEGHSEDEGSEYRRAMVITCRAVIAWAGRYASEAGRLAENHPDPRVREALLRVARSCEHVPAKPARDLFDALEAIALVHMAIAIEGHGYSVSPGLLDRILLPYFTGAAETTELLAAFMLKLSANSIWGSHSKTQAITLGGLDAQGKDMCSPLTLRFLDACDLIRMPDPHVFLRWHEKMDRRVKERAIELLGLGLSMPMLVGDEQTTDGLVHASIPSADAWGYCVIGCNELGIPGKLWDSATGPSMVDPAILNEALMNAPESIGDMPDLLAAVQRTMKEHITRALKGAQHHWDWAARNVPTPFTSALMDGCVERGCDFHAGSQYSRPVLMERGFVTAVNGLSAIEQVVFKDRSVSLGDLADALKNNFDDGVDAHRPSIRSSRTQNYSGLDGPKTAGQMEPITPSAEGVSRGHRIQEPPSRTRDALLTAPKWGNDDDRADTWAKVWLEMRERTLREVENEIGDVRHVVQHVIRSLHHIDGSGLGATPDGRLAGSPTADSIGPTAGTALEGPTALLNSVLKLRPSVYWQGGYNLNLTIAPAPATDPCLRENLLALVEAFFANGGQELQIGCLDAEILCDAKTHPDKYPHLLVRIAGFNALFAKLSPAEQDELIARAGV